jgi:hypothetical protein
LSPSASLSSFASSSHVTHVLRSTLKIRLWTFCFLKVMVLAVGTPCTWDKSSLFGQIECLHLQSGRVISACDIFCWFFLCLLLGPEDGGDMFLRLTRPYTVFLIVTAVIPSDPELDAQRGTRYLHRRCSILRTKCGDERAKETGVSVAMKKSVGIELMIYRCVGSERCTRSTTHACTHTHTSLRCMRQCKQSGHCRT